ncbi:MAG: RDD family protein, partial [Sphingomonas sp.]|nr:RDD family protein [Sphingomonas sp.]
IVLGVLIGATLLLALLATGPQSGNLIAILWLVVFFVLRNGWFILFEMGGRGATPGKRALGLRVVARDGARLTGGAVIARNAMREVELFVPLSFALGQSFQSNGDAAFAIAALLWSGIFLFFPLFNRDRLRVGDLLAGTWVIEAGKTALAADLALAPPARRFSDAALALYGEYELQTLEDVLRARRPQAMSVVAATIRAKAGLPDDGDDEAFLRDYYAALCARLEAGMLVGRRRADKFA